MIVMKSEIKSIQVVAGEIVEEILEKALNEFVVVKERVEGVEEQEVVEKVKEKVGEMTEKEESLGNVEQVAVEAVEVEVVDTLDEVAAKETNATVKEEEEAEEEEVVIAATNHHDIVADIPMPLDEVVKEYVAAPELDDVQEEQSEVTTQVQDTGVKVAADQDALFKDDEEELLPIASTKAAAATPSNSLVRKPTNRTLQDGPVVPVSQIQSSVGRINPVHDELLYTIDSCARNEASLTKIEIVDYQLTQNQVSALATALATNTHITTLILEGCGIQTAPGIQLAKALSAPTCRIEKLSLERNALGPQAMKELAKMVAVNQSLQDLRLGVQASISPMGLEAEQWFAESMQKNVQITKLHLVCKSAHCRDSVDRAVTRNKEMERKARLAAAAKEA